MYKNNLFKGKKLRKIISLGLVVVTLMSAVGCGSTAKNSSEANGTGNNTLTISVITKDKYLDAAVQLFQEQHPGTTIDVKEYTSNPLPTGDDKNKMVKVGENPEDVEKYVSSMNTQMMSGKGPDIMLLSPLPYEKYIDKNILVNLSEMMQSDANFDINKYYTNILDAMKYNGNLYGLPLSVSLNVLQANKALLDKYNIKIEDDKWNWDDFEQTAERIVESSKKDGVLDMYALSGMNGSMLISSLVSESYNKFVDKNKKAISFDDREFIDLLNLAKSMIDKNYIDTDTSQGKMADIATRGNTVFSASKIMMHMDMMLAKQIFSEGVEFLKYPGEGTDLSFTTNTLYGINNKSSNKTLAWEFLKFLTSDEMMSQASIMGLPVNKEAAEMAAQNALEISKKMNGNGDGKGKMVLSMNGQKVTLNKPLTQDDVNVVQNLLSSANKYTKVDKQVLTIVQEETRSFFEGQKTADDTAKTIQDRVNTYINE
jgi:multiple sugar transport system substrate-binding protein